MFRLRNGQIYGAKHHLHSLQNSISILHKIPPRTNSVILNVMKNLSFLRILAGWETHPLQSVCILFMFQMTIAKESKASCANDQRPTN